VVSSSGRYTYIGEELTIMRAVNGHRTDSLARPGGDWDRSDAKITNLSKLLAAVTDETRRLVVENRTLWDLLSYDSFGLDRASGAPAADSLAKTSKSALG
jgi:hypothetical protein